MGTANRTIRFYRLKIGKEFLDQNGAKQLLINLSNGINSKTTLLKYYCPEKDIRIFAHKIDIAHAPLKVVIAKTVTALLPSKEKKQKIEPLDLVDDDDQEQGLSHKTHLCIFKDGIVGIESYGDSIGQNQLAEFFTYFTGHPVSLKLLLNSNYATKLARLNDITMLKIRIHSELLPDLQKEKNSLLSKLSNLDPAGSEEIELTLKVNASTKSSSLNGIPGVIKNLMKFGMGDKVSNIEVKGRSIETLKIEHHDLIDAALVSHQVVVRSNDKTKDVKEASVFAKIGEAYSSLADEIEMCLKGNKE